ncbi:MAG: aminoacyl-tRNA hydrolase [Pseudanabaenaceae cyanobacterium bins.68]|nr:aminoacyl-tRNA hydrolase [Pseudanabaenaceae cyanobacterium bins.68]
MVSLIVGLGNPGEKYDRTRHNIGFMVIDHLAKQWQVSLVPERKFKGSWAEKTWQSGNRVYLLKPSTFMNLSGESAIALLKWYKLTPASVLVIYDDMDIPLGRIRIKPSGSAGGHNGMKSVIAHLGTSNFPRLRVGIGAPKHPQEAKDPERVVGHVLGNFSATEAKRLPELLGLTEEAIATIFTEGLDKAMSVYNSRGI